jgi:Sec-independent protein secretion pathway component TatC
MSGPLLNHSQKLKAQVRTAVVIIIIIIISCFFALCYVTSPDFGVVPFSNNKITLADKIGEIANPTTRLFSPIYISLHRVFVKGRGLRRASSREIF